jgi:hypothetical protein
MENLTPESRALYDLLRAESKEEYESRFIVYKKELLDTIKVFIDDTTGQLSDINATINDARAQMSADLQATKESIGVDLKSVKTTLNAEITGLAATLDRANRLDPTTKATASSSSITREMEPAAAGPNGRRWEHLNQGITYAPHTYSPKIGTKFDHNFPNSCQFNIFCQNDTDLEIPCLLHMLICPNLMDPTPNCGNDVVRNNFTVDQHRLISGQACHLISSQGCCNMA